MKTKELVFKDDYASEVNTFHNTDGTADVESKGLVFQKGDLINAHRATNESVFIKDTEGNELAIPKDKVRLATSSDQKTGEQVIPKAKKTQTSRSSTKTISPATKKIIIRVALGVGIYVVLYVLYKSIIARKDAGAAV